MPKSRSILNLLLGLLLLLPWVTQAQVVALDPVIQGQPLGTYLHYCEDRSGKASLADMMLSSCWQSVKEDVPNFGFSHQAYWFRLDMQAAELQEPWMLEIAYNLLDEVQFYLLDGNSRVVTQNTLGMLYPDSGEGRYNRMLLQPLSITKAGQYTVYLRIHSGHALHVPVYLWMSSEYLVHVEQDNMVLGIFFGTFVILLLYNFFLFTLSGDRLYLSYAGLTLALMFFHAQLRSLGVRMWFPQWVQWNGPLVLLSSLLATYMLAHFAERFLQLENTRFPLKRIYLHLRWMCLVTGAIILWSRTEHGLYLMVFLIALTSMVTFVAVLYCYRSNDRPLRWFSGAWFMFFFGIMGLAGSKVAILPFNVVTDHAISVAALVGMMMISMAMSDRNNQRVRQAMQTHQQVRLQLDQKIEAAARRLRNEEMERTAAEISLRLQTESNERLQRDLELREQDIDALAEQLREAARIDPLTSVFNRAFFNQRLKEEFERASRSQQRLSLVFIGVRQLDTLMQRFGFKACDEVIRQAADVIASVSRHHCASVYRFDEHVFAVMLPGTSVHRSQAIAEMLRSAFDDQHFLFAGQLLDVSVGVGVGSLQPHGKLRQEMLVSSAEDALRTAWENSVNAIAINADRVG